MPKEAAIGYIMGTTTRRWGDVHDHAEKKEYDVDEQHHDELVVGKSRVSRPAICFGTCSAAMIQPKAVAAATHIMTTPVVMPVSPEYFGDFFYGKLFIHEHADNKV
jgi:hypothetical protein